MLDSRRQREGVNDSYDRRSGFLISICPSLRDRANTIIEWQIHVSADTIYILHGGPVQGPKQGRINSIYFFLYISVSPEPIPFELLPVMVGVKHPIALQRPCQDLDVLGGTYRVSETPYGCPSATESITCLTTKHVAAFASRPPCSLRLTSTLHSTLLSTVLTRCGLSLDLTSKIAPQG